MMVLPGNKDPEEVETKTNVTETLGLLAKRSREEIMNEVQFGVVNEVQSKTINTGSVRQ